MRINGLLIRWRGGYATEFDAASEGDLGRVVWRLLDIPDVDSYDEVERIVAAEFDRFASEQVAFSMTVDTRNGPIPFADYGIGDSVLVPNIQAGTTTVRVTGMMVTEDEDGGVYYAPEVGEPFEDDVTLLKRVAAKLAPGSLGGRSEIAHPIQPRRQVGERSKRRDRTITEFEGHGGLTTGLSSPYEFTQRELVVGVLFTAGTAGGSDSTFTLKLNGATVGGGVLTFPSGSTETEVSLASFFEGVSGDQLKVQVNTDGGHEDVNVQILRSP